MISPCLPPLPHSKSTISLQALYLQLQPRLLDSRPLLPALFFTVTWLNSTSCIRAQLKCLPSFRRLLTPSYVRALLKFPAPCTTFILLLMVKGYLRGAKIQRAEVRSRHSNKGNGWKRNCWLFLLDFVFRYLKTWA